MALSMVMMHHANTHAHTHASFDGLVHGHDASRKHTHAHTRVSFDSLGHVHDALSTRASLLVGTGDLALSG